MTIMEKVVSALTPSESDEKRQAARSKARNAASGNDWLSLVLSQHEQIESAFQAVRSSTDAATRLAAQKELALLLNGHSLAEETVLYPALGQLFGEHSKAGMSYAEHANAKVLLGGLEYCSPMSQEYTDKLERLCEAVRHHMYEEEDTRFMELKQQASTAVQAKLTERFREEYDRYCGMDASTTSAGMATSPGMTPGTRPTSPPPMSH